mgnify:CR=1 FL=1
MLDIVAHLKIDESKPERTAYLLATLRSYLFFRSHFKLYLNLESPSPALLQAVQQAVKRLKYNALISTTPAVAHYGDVYSALLALGENPFVLNMLEDHFIMLNDAEAFAGLLQKMHTMKVDVCKSSFFKVERNSINSMMPGFAVDNRATTICMSPQLFASYQRHYGSRYYIGVNFITTRDFALRFWNRKLGPRPHEYEIANYAKEWEHIAMVSPVELHASIDDNHGEPATCLLERQDAKWISVMRDVDMFAKS